MGTRVTSEIVDHKTEGYCPNTFKSLPFISPLLSVCLSFCLSFYLSIHLLFSLISLALTLYPPACLSDSASPLHRPPLLFFSSFLIQRVKIGRGYFNILREENAMKKRQQLLQKMKEEELNKFQPAKKFSDIQCRDTLLT